jgi:hypothetical protein
VASAWGKAWGKAWGFSWGAVAPAPLPAPAGGFSDAPWKWVPFQPVPTRRPRRRRAAELLFIKP